MRIRLRERLLDRSSLAMSSRQVKVVALAGVMGVAGATGVALRGDDLLKGPTLVPETAAGVPVSVAPKGTPLLRVAALEVVDPAQAGLDPARLDDAMGAVRREVARGAFPGAVLAVGRGPEMVVLEGFGRTAWGDEQVDPARTVYDLASLTKVVATTTAVMLLVEDGRMELDAPVQRYLPEFSGGAKALVTVRHLLTHTSGLPAGTDVGGLSAPDALRKILQHPLINQPGEEVEYTDLGFVTLFAAAERAAGEPIPDLLARRVFAPLAMKDTRYLPGDGCEACAPTMVDDGQVVRGTVHDPIARQLGGVAGNAGLFAPAPDLARFAAMLANGGELDGVRVLKQETIDLFTRRQPGAETRALGWDTPERDGGGAAGRRISPRAFGHTGYTGTSLWVDPDRGTWTILLTNRTYEPRAANRIQALRRDVHDEVALAATADSIEEANSTD
jgi:CubicO group peptidase (beta-lactamase class C family)